MDPQTSTYFCRLDSVYHNLNSLSLSLSLSLVPLSLSCPRSSLQLHVELGSELSTGGAKYPKRDLSLSRGKPPQLSVTYSSIYLFLCLLSTHFLPHRYLADPLLIGGNKIDLRVYVYVSSYDPLMIYVFPDGLTRFATCKYAVFPLSFLLSLTPFSAIFFNFNP